MRLAPPKPSCRPPVEKAVAQPLEQRAAWSRRVRREDLGPVAEVARETRLDIRQQSRGQKLARRLERLVRVAVPVQQQSRWVLGVVDRVFGGSFSVSRYRRADFEVGWFEGFLKKSERDKTTEKYKEYRIRKMPKIKNKWKTMNTPKPQKIWKIKTKRKPERQIEI